MDFDTFIDRYAIYTDIDTDLREIVTLSKETLNQMLIDLYTEAYNDGKEDNTNYDLVSSDGKVIGSFKA